MSGKAAPTRKQALNAIDVLSKVAKKGMVGYSPAAPMNAKRRRTKAKGTSSTKRSKKSRRK